MQLQRKELEYTRQVLARTANAHEQSAQMMNEQLRLSNLPFLQYNSRIIRGQKCLVISNESENPAFDIDIWIFVTENDDTYPREQFIKNKVKPEYYKVVKNINKLVDDQIWAISERGIYHSFPRNKKINIPINFEIGYGDFEIYIQYRDNLGNNYSQSICFSENDSSQKPFQDVIYQPNIPTITERIDFLDEYLNEGNIPQIAKGLVDLQETAIFSSYLKDTNFKGVENRWDMVDL